MPKFEKKPEVVDAFRTRGDRIVDTVDGPKKAQPGQWIVWVADGKYAIVDDAEFREKYVAKDKDAKQQLKSGGPVAETVEEEEEAGEEEEDEEEETEDEDEGGEEEEEAPKVKGVLDKIKDAVTGKGKDTGDSEEDGKDK